MKKALMFSTDHQDSHHHFFSWTMRTVSERPIARLKAEARIGGAERRMRDPGV